MVKVAYTKDKCYIGLVVKVTQQEIELARPKGKNVFYPHKDVIIRNLGESV